MLVDSHCHLHDPWFNEESLEAIVKRALDSKVEYIINCASDPKNFEQVLDSTSHDEIFATLGMQPTLAKDNSDASALRSIENLEKKVLAIGEVGLDYYWIKDPKERALQEDLFVDCINLANELNLPLVCHTRKAETESLDLLEKYAETPVLLHSFDGNLKEINRAVDLGYLITVPTIVTRRKNRRKVAQRAGLENIMLETDSPFCTHDEQIERNEPKYILNAAKYLSELLEEELDEVAKVTSDNALKFHRLK